MSIRELPKMSGKDFAQMQRTPVTIPACDVTIQNNSGSEQSYIFYSDPPIVEGVQKFVQYIIATAPHIPNGGSKQLRLEGANHAIRCEMMGLELLQNDAKPFQLANYWYKGGSIISFGGAVSSGQVVSKENAFRIYCGSNREENVVGIGTKVDGVRTIPVATWDPEEGKGYTVLPKDRPLHCAVVPNHDPGTLGWRIYPRKLTLETAKIDPPEGRATLTHGPDGKISVTQESTLESNVAE